MQKLNSQLPMMPATLKPANLKSRIYGAIFLLLVGTFLISLIYNWRYPEGESLGPGNSVKDENEGVACIQVITPARNLTTGEVRDFPTPCDVPAGWEKINPPSSEVIRPNA